MVKKLTAAILGIFMIGLYGCKIQTPEIRGVVIDEQTQQPVADAWIFATLVVETQTVQGGVTTTIALEEPHTRSNEKGEFIIPARELTKGISLFELKAEIREFSVGANAIDERVGLEHIKNYERKDKVDIVIPIRLLQRSEREYFSYLQGLYHYCLTGRRGIRVPAVEKGCDQWELDYAIAKHERFLERLGEPKTMDQRIYCAGAMQQLAALYRKKGDYRKALDTFIRLRDFDRKRNVDLYLKRYEVEIGELQELLRDRKNQ